MNASLLHYQLVVYAIYFVEIDLCVGEPCLFSSKCGVEEVDGDRKLLCTCAAGYTGHLCEVGKCYDISPYLYFLIAHRKNNYP